MNDSEIEETSITNILIYPSPLAETVAESLEALLRKAEMSKTSDSMTDALSRSPRSTKDRTGSSHYFFGISNTNR